MRREDIRGTMTALITPFRESGDEVDAQSFEGLIDYQLQAKVDGLVVAGSTGESPCLTLDEYERLVRLTRGRVKGQVPVIAGVSQSSTDRAIEAGRVAAAAGADALLVAAPPYNKPSQEGIYFHIRAIARATGLPIIAYNIPGRSGVAIAPATVARMAAEGFVAAAKDSTGSLDAVLDLLACAPPQLRVLSGEDSLVWPIMCCGGVGTISASANVAPDRFVALTRAAQDNDVETARRLQLQLIPLIRVLFLETNPAPAKAALWLKGIIKTPTVRPPLLRAGMETVERLREVLGL